MVGQYTFEQFCEIVSGFHGSAAPGVLIGGFMVEAARSSLPAGILYEALCETRLCLADAVQLLTPCTVGNGRLKIAHVGRFAITLYDKFSGEGFRAHLDLEKLDTKPEIRSWFLKLKDKKEQDHQALLREIEEAGTSIVTVAPMTVQKEFFKKKKLGPVKVCPVCKESFPVSDGKLCGGCRGELPYDRPFFRRSPGYEDIREAWNPEKLPSYEKL